MDMENNFVLNQFYNPQRKVIENGDKKEMAKETEKLTVEDKIEKDLQQFENTRDAIGKEIIQTVEDLKRLMDMMLAGITNDLGQQAAETDEILETCILESKRLLGRKKELHSVKEKLNHSIMAVLN